MKNTIYLFVFFFAIIVSMHAYADQETFTANQTWQVPTGVTTIFVEAWGAGGNGATISGSNTGGGGGGGGAYSAGVFTVSPGSNYTVTVGTSNGQNSSFNNTSTLILAVGGGNGAGTTAGSGGSSSSGTGTIKYSGGTGGTGLSGPYYPGTGGGGAGTTSSGSNGINSGGDYGAAGGSGGSLYGGTGGGVSNAGTGGDGVAGSTIAGGGGGAWRGSSGPARTGGAGARGEVRVSYGNSIIFLLDEQTNLPINSSVTVWLVNPDVSYNFTTTAGNYTQNLVIPGDYQIIYSATNYRTREHYFTYDGSAINITLYDILENESDFFTVIETDPYGFYCSNNTVSLLRYYVDINGYNTVEMAKTNTLGQALLSVEPNIINYKLFFNGSCGTYVSDPSKLTSSSQTYTVSDAQSVLSGVNGYAGTSKALSFDNTTDTFVFTWSGTSYLTEACLLVDKYNSSGITSVSSNCSSSTTGSLIYTVTDTNNTRYVATGTLTISGTTISDSIEYRYQPSFNGFGLTGVFLTLLVLLLFVFLVGSNSESTVIGGIMALFIMGSFGFIYNTYFALLGMVIVTAIIVYKTRT